MTYPLTVPRGPDVYIKFLKNKFKVFDDVYWQILDDLEQKMDDLNIKMPDLSLREFSFVVEWMHGEVSSDFVYNIMKGMDIDQVAGARVTRKLLNFGENKDEISDMTRHVVKELSEKAAPLYAAYLKLLKKYFEIVARTDAESMQLTWLEQILPDNANGEMKVVMDDIHLNQFINLIDTFRLPNIDDKYFIDDNIICLSETNSDNRSVNWIFGPKSHIDILKKIYNIKNRMGASDKEYITKLISGY